jgi:phosphoribosyl 1,2-cyclic phosphodiesterase
MCLSVASLNSGSNGNCYYIESANDAILIDAGISCREIEKRMQRLGLSPQKVKAIFITHEHADHIFGLISFLKKFPVPVYITRKTSLHVHDLPQQLVNTINTNEIITVGELSVTAFSTLHDAADSCGFIINCNNVTAGVFTDIGYACENVIHYFRQCHAAFLEANYDNDMLQKGRYPYHLKQRISNGWGHLSNKEAFELFDTCEAPHLSHVFLSHLSADNSHPDIALETFRRTATNVSVTIASRYEPMALQHIGVSDIAAQPVLNMQQTSLF